jgi:hypothetical protein
MSDDAQQWPLLQIPQTTFMTSNRDFNMNPITAFLVLACLVGSAAGFFWGHLYLTYISVAAAVLIGLSLKMANIGTGSREQARRHARFARTGAREAAGGLNPAALQLDDVRPQRGTTVSTSGSSWQAF